MIAAKHNTVIELRLFGNEIFFISFEWHANLLAFFVNTPFVIQNRFTLAFVF